MTTRKRKKRKTPAKGVTLNDKWIKNSKEVKELREKLLLEQEGKCAISNVEVVTGCLDHTHEQGVGKEGATRGVLLSEVNMLEGRYLKLFQKLKLDVKYGIDFPEFLISMGKYLQKDNSCNKLHYKHMEDFRKKVNRWTIPVLTKKLLEDYGIVGTGDKKELVRLYVQAWVDEQE